MMRLNASYKITEIEDNTVYIVDVSEAFGTKTVTNDAEAVVKEINRYHPNHRVVYMDTKGSIDELLHEDGIFKGFKHLPHVNGR